MTSLEVYHIRCFDSYYHADSQHQVMHSGSSSQLKVSLSVTSQSLPFILILHSGLVCRVNLRSPIWSTESCIWKPYLLPERLNMSTYPQNTNPFGDNDDDRDSFGRVGTGEGGYGHSGADFGGFRDVSDEEFGRPLSRTEYLQQQKQLSMNRTMESSQRAISSIYDSERMGIATAEVSRAYTVLQITYYYQ